MKALVLGSNGYLGRQLAYFLKKQGWDITGADLGEDSLVSGIIHHPIDVTDVETLTTLDFNADYIFCFAALTGTFQSNVQNTDYTNVNEIGLLNLLNTMRDKNCKARIVFPSTRLIYKGIKNTPLTEDSEKEFKTIYSLNKFFGEKVLNLFAENFGIKYNVFRICVPYGSFLNDNYSYGTIGFFLDNARNGKPIPLYGDGELKRTFTHVEDICNQIVHCIQSPGSLNQTFNIGGETFSLKQIASQIAYKFQTEVKLTPWPNEAFKLETGDTIFDGTKLDKINNVHYKNRFKHWLHQL